MCTGPTGLTTPVSCWALGVVDCFQGDAVETAIPSEADQDDQEFDDDDVDDECETASSKVLTARKMIHIFSGILSKESRQ